MYKVSALLGFTRAELVSTEIWSDFVEHSGFQARIGLRGMFFVMGSPWLLHCPSHCPSTVPPLSLHCRSRWPFVPPNVAPAVAPVAPVAPGVPPTVAPTVPPLSLHRPSPFGSVDGLCHLQNMLFRAFGLQQAVIFDCLRFCVAAMPSDPATPACAAPEVLKEATRAAGATTAAGAKPARPTEPKAATATSDPVINKAAAATSDPVIKFKRGLRQFFDDPETTRKSEYPLTRSEALELVQAVHEDRKRALGAEKSKEMTEAALKRARSDNLALQSEINQKDATILALQENNRNLWSQNAALNRKMSSLKGIVTDCVTSVNSVHGIVESFEAAMIPSNPDTEDTQTE